LGNDNYSTLIPERTELPNENPITLPFSTYCIDPRDGYAIFEFARPVWPGRNLPGDPRKSYATLLVAVDPEATPLTEKLKVEIAIDHDLIVTVAAESTMVKHRRKREIHNLEFGLSVGTKSIESSPDGRKTEKQSNIPYKKTEGSIKLRSNVVRGNQAWDLVPGDLVEKYRIHLPPQWTATKRQHDEEMYYIPCSGCDRTWHQIQLEGSENCPCRAGNVKEIDAQKRKRKLLERKKELEIRESTLNEGKK
jgi:hypothetical protein